MSKKHDENKDLKSFSKVGKVNIATKTLSCSKSTHLGIHMLGRIDFLTKYCGWHFVYNNNVIVNRIDNDDNKDKKTTRTDKKVKKEHKLTDKTKKKK